MTNKAVSEKLIELLDERSEPFLTDNQFNLKSLMDRIGEARFVLIGEATHGTAEFYEARAEITKQLIIQKGFMAVAIEGDWPDVYRMDRYVKSMGDINIQTALNGFERFPQWMWRNVTLPPFLTWLRDFNDRLPHKAKVGFYGLDLYSLHHSMHAVIAYLQKTDPEAAKRAIERYACFDHVSFEPENYGYLISIGLKESCIRMAVDQLMELQHNAYAYLKQDGMDVEDEYFYATQNARLVKNAESYYRAHFENSISSWNIRDTHMMQTLNVLSDHIEKRLNKPAKIVIWAHNSHVGDARATEMGDQGEINIGQLIREEHENDCYIIGFSTYEGEVTAASTWGGPAIRKVVKPGLPSSYEELFHQLKYDNFQLHVSEDKQIEHYLHYPRLQRAIGVIYRPETERISHYFLTKLPYQFDTVIHFDKTHAIEPLDMNREWIQ